MTDQPTPWNFHNTDRKLLSPDGRYKLVYYNLNEIAMGAPLGGMCFLEGDGIKLKIHDWCGGPPVWENGSQSFVIPTWTRIFSQGMIQQIGIVELENLVLKIFEKSFRVVDLHSFEGNIVRMTNNNESFSFDIEREKMETVIKLQI